MFREPNKGQWVGNTFDTVERSHECMWQAENTRGQVGNWGSGRLGESYVLWPLCPLPRTPHGHNGRYWRAEKYLLIVLGCNLRLQGSFAEQFPIPWNPVFFPGLKSNTWSLPRAYNWLLSLCVPVMVPDGPRKYGAALQSTLTAARPLPNSLSLPASDMDPILQISRTVLGGHCWVLIFTQVELDLGWQCWWPGISSGGHVGNSQVEWGRACFPSKLLLHTQRAGKGRTYSSGPPTHLPGICGYSPPSGYPGSLRGAHK